MGSIHKLIYHNDRMLPLDEVRLSPGQAALFNGWGIFTTMRIYDGVPFGFERHWNRLMTDARLLQMPVKHAPEPVRAAATELLRANAVGEGCIRVYFLYNKIGFWCSNEPMPTVDFLMYTTDLPKRVGPTQLGVQAHGRHAANPLTGRKVTSWLQNVFSLEQAHQRGFEEVVLLNERDEVAECTAANLYRVRGGTVATPPLAAGCLAGVTRQVVMELAPALGIQIKERPLKLDDLYGADEVFMTSTTREVQPVSQIEQHKFANAPGPITARLAQAFSSYVKRYVAEQKQAQKVSA
jgi:branched-chain amino acid aminotransferase